VGAFILSFMPELLRFLKENRGVVNGIILMLTIIYLPDGLVSPKWFRRRKTEAVQGETAVA
jgi:branched-chain amino acid transport system permease protein